MTLNDVEQLNQLLLGKTECISCSDEKAKDLLVFKETAFTSDPLQFEVKLEEQNQNSKQLQEF